VSDFASQANSLFGLYDLSSAAAFAKATVFRSDHAVHLGPRSFLQLLGGDPYFEKLPEEGRRGPEERSRQYTPDRDGRLAAVQSIAFSKFLESLGAAGVPVVPHPDPCSSS